MPIYLSCYILFVKKQSSFVYVCVFRILFMYTILSPAREYWKHLQGHLCLLAAVQ